MRDGESASAEQIFSKFLEREGNAAVRYTGSPAIKCHLRPDLIWDKTHPDAKYIIVVRNPKDTCVSHFHHTRGFPGFNFQDGTFDVWFDLFMEGKVEFGSYFDWIVSAVEHKYERNVLFLTYESMKEDTVAAIIKIANFLSTESDDYSKRFREDHDTLISQ